VERVIIKDLKSETYSAGSSSARKNELLTNKIIELDGRPTMASPPRFSRRLPSTSAAMCGREVEDPK